MFAGPGLPESLFGGLLDHLVDFIRLISGCKVQLPAFRLHFTWFKARFDHVFVFKGAFCWCLDPDLDRFSSLLSRVELSLQCLD